MEIRLSVIIPVYNVGAYLGKCLDSVFGQTLPADEYELICVDDGSTDRSPEILARYGREHGNLRTIQQNNAGSSVARNRGLELAKGKYVYFMDGDDWLSRPDALKLLCERAERLELDELIFNAEFAYEAGQEKRRDRPRIYFLEGDALCAGDAVRSGQQTFALLYGSDMFPIVVWRRLYRRAFLMESGLRFVPGILHQDNAFTVEATALARRVNCWSFSGYTYLYRPDSVCRNRKKYPFRSIYSRLVGSQDMEAFARQRLGDADAAFLRCYEAFVQKWRDGNARMYLEQPPSQRRSFWKTFPAQARGMYRRQMAEAVRRVRREAGKQWLRRHVPAPVRRALRALLGR